MGTDEHWEQMNILNIPAEILISEEKKKGKKGSFWDDFATYCSGDLSVQLCMLNLIQRPPCIFYSKQLLIE